MCASHLLTVQRQAACLPLSWVGKWGQPPLCHPLSCGAKTRLVLLGGRGGSIVGLLTNVEFSPF